MFDAFRPLKNLLHNIIRPRLGAFWLTYGFPAWAAAIVAAPSGIRQSIVGCHHLGID